MLTRFVIGSGCPTLPQQLIWPCPTFVDYSTLEKNQVPRCRRATTRTHLGTVGDSSSSFDRGDRLSRWRSSSSRRRRRSSGCARNRSLEARNNALNGRVL